MVQGNHHHAVVAGQVRAVVADEFLARAFTKATPVQPNHYGAFLPVMDAAGPHIDPEAVLVVETIIPVHREGLVVGPPAGTGGRRRRGAERPAGTDVRPRVGIDGRRETLRLGIRNTLVDEHPVVEITGDGTGNRFDSRLLGRSFQAAEALDNPPGRLSAGDGERRGEQKSEVVFQCHNKRFSFNAKFLNKPHNPFLSFSFLFASERPATRICSNFFLFVQK